MWRYIFNPRVQLQDASLSIPHQIRCGWYTTHSIFPHSFVYKKIVISQNLVGPIDKKKMKVTLEQLNGLNQRWTIYRNGNMTFLSCLEICHTLILFNLCGTHLVAWCSHLLAEDRGWSLKATTKSNVFLSCIVKASPPITTGTLFDSSMI